jgi:PAS domain S-box-containing protein
MWEKIVLNLLSNAFKFTFRGEVAVSLHLSPDQRRVELTVRDTGTGIPEAELPRLFERFHRVEGAKGRSYEGSGIGLALVQELAKLHGGTITVQSELDQGSSFTVSIPRGKDHLPAGHVRNTKSQVSTALKPQAFVEEALSWLPREGAPLAEAVFDNILPETLPPLGAVEGRPRILLADDNTDMRSYVCRLLAHRFDVEAVGDGEAALASAKERPPQLVLSDVMMPMLDGFGLIKALRADQRLRDIPIILLSARAGEEAKIEGLDAGARDYLVKPFSSRELVARVQANLQMSQIRKTAEEALRRRTHELETVLDTIPTAVWFTYDREASHVMGNRQAARLLGLPANATVSLTAPGASRRKVQVFRRGKEVALESLPLQRAARGEAVGEEELEIRLENGRRKILLVRAAALRDPSAQVQGAVAAAVDITDRKRSEEERARYVRLLDSGFDAIIIRDRLDRITSWNRGATQLYGWTPDEALGVVTHILFQTKFPKPLDQILDGVLRDGHWEGELIHTRKDGTVITVFSRWTLERDAQGQPAWILETNMDITERKAAEQHHRLLINELNHRVKNTLATVQSMAVQTSRNSEDREEVRRHLEGRLLALARAHDVLTRESWEGATLSAIISRKR